MTSLSAFKEKGDRGSRPFLCCWCRKEELNPRPSHYECAAPDNPQHSATPGNNKNQAVAAVELSHTVVNCCALLHALCRECATTAGRSADGHPAGGWRPPTEPAVRSHASGLTAKQSAWSACPRQPSRERCSPRSSPSLAASWQGVKFLSPLFTARPCRRRKPSGPQFRGFCRSSGHRDRGSKSGQSIRTLTQRPLCAADATQASRNPTPINPSTTPGTTVANGFGARLSICAWISSAVSA